MANLKKNNLIIIIIINNILINSYILLWKNFYDLTTLYSDHYNNTSKKDLLKAINVKIKWFSKVK